MTPIPTLPAALLAGSAALCIAGISVYSNVTTLNRTSIYALSLVPTDADVADALTRAGLDPASLAAAGVAPADVDDIVTAVRAWLTSNPTAISSADGVLRAATSQSGSLQRLIASGRSSAEDRTAYATALVNLAQAESDLAGALDAVFTAGTDGLSQSIIDTLDAIRSNAGVWGQLPTEFLVVTDRTEAQWVSLRDALANERICADLGEEMHGGCQTLLADARTDEEVAAATSSLNSNLTAVTTEWNTHIRE